MRDRGLLREVALVLALAVDDPDVPALVAAAIAKERDRAAVRRPPGAHAPLGASRELEELVALDRRRVDLEVAGLVPRERDLVRLRRQVDGTEAPVDVGRAREVLDRVSLEAVADGLRL